MPTTQGPQGDEGVREEVGWSGDQEADDPVRVVAVTDPVHRLPVDYGTHEDDFVLRLFFAARGMAEEVLVRRIREHFFVDGFDVIAMVRESCLAAHVELTHRYKSRSGKPRTQVRTMYLDRIRAWPPRAGNSVSQSLYRLRHVQIGDYYPHVKPSREVDFDLALEEFIPTLSGWIDKLNYPFWDDPGYGNLST
jgi:hypothetical protein